MGKYILFFLLIVGVFFYALMFNENRQKIKIRILGKEREITLGLLLLSVFLDGAILSFILFYLLLWDL